MPFLANPYYLAIDPECPGTCQSDLVIIDIEVIKKNVQKGEEGLGKILQQSTEEQPRNEQGQLLAPNHVVDCFSVE